MEALRNKLHIRNELARALVGEFVGTAILLVVGTSVVAQSVLPRPKLNEILSVNIGFGLAVAFGIAVSARLSGGHLNPAVSVMFLSFRQLTPVRFVLYVLVQTAGAFFGAALTYIVYRDAISAFDGGARTVTGVKATAGIFASYPAAHLSLCGGFIDQLVATAFFCFAIAHITDRRNNYPNWTQPYFIGLALIAVGAAFGYNCGYPINPARDFGPRLFTFLVGYGADVFTHKSWSWVPIIAPLFGGALGAWVYQLTIGFHTPAANEEKYELVATSAEAKPLTKEGETA